MNNAASFSYLPDDSFGSPIYILIDNSEFIWWKWKNGHDLDQDGWRRWLDWNETGKRHLKVFEEVDKKFIIAYNQYKSTLVKHPVDIY